MVGRDPEQIQFPSVHPKQKSSRPSPQSGGFIDRYFHISERGSTVGRELRGGFATFFAMSYIIVLNPLIIGVGHLNWSVPRRWQRAESARCCRGDLTDLGLTTIVMVVLGKFPMAVSSLGLSAFITYGIVVLPGMTWADAMGLVVIEGVILRVLVLTGFRSAIFNAVPGALKTAISVGIGLFIALIGMINAGFIRTPEEPVWSWAWTGSSSARRC